MLQVDHVTQRGRLCLYLVWSIWVRIEAWSAEGDDIVIKFENLVLWNQSKDNRMNIQPSTYNHQRTTINLITTCEEHSTATYLGYFKE